METAPPAADRRKDRLPARGVNRIPGIVVVRQAPLFPVSFFREAQRLVGGIVGRQVKNLFLLRLDRPVVEMDPAVILDDIGPDFMRRVPLLDQQFIEPLELVLRGVEVPGVVDGDMGRRGLETVVPGAKDQAAFRLDFRTEPFIAQDRTFLVVVELAGHDGHRHVHFPGNPLQVAPDAGIPIGVRIVRMRNPVPVIVQPLAQHGHIRFDLRTVEVEIVVVLPDRLPLLAFRFADRLLGIVDEPSAHDVFPEQAGTEAGDMTVDPVMGQVHALELVRNGIRDDPPGQRRIGTAEDSEGFAPGLAA